VGWGGVGWGARGWRADGCSGRRGTRATGRRGGGAAGRGGGGPSPRRSRSPARGRPPPPWPRRSGLPRGPGRSSRDRTWGPRGTAFSSSAARVGWARREGAGAAWTERLRPNRGSGGRMTAKTRPRSRRWATRASAREGGDRTRASRSRVLASPSTGPGPACRVPTPPPRPPGVTDAHPTPVRPQNRAVTRPSAPHRAIRTLAPTPPQRPRPGRNRWSFRPIGV